MPSTNEPQRFLRESGYTYDRGVEYVGSDAGRYSRKESNRRVAAREAGERESERKEYDE